MTTFAGVTILAEPGVTKYAITIAIAIAIAIATAIAIAIAIAIANGFSSQRRVPEQPLLTCTHRCVGKEKKRKRE